MSTVLFTQYRSPLVWYCQTLMKWDSGLYYNTCTCVSCKHRCSANQTAAFLKLLWVLRLLCHLYLCFSLHFLAAKVYSLIKYGDHEYTKWTKVNYIHRGIRDGHSCKLHSTNTMLVLILTKPLAPSQWVWQHQTRSPYTQFMQILFKIGWVDKTPSWFTFYIVPTHMCFWE